ncbi:methylation-associated defense system protein kinase MAD6 [Actinomadura madurae]|uniref:methylation-associated defense system protein kinase MAD6 n=1 Tax=Actinomadura madurae TaxID=1993 RepID=UPI000D82F91A|nr:serine/threonine protein kinase [Actinomadura madurae]SPT60098.1 Serine/threonine-protein kinase pknB [Actinomadura madurae]
MADIVGGGPPVNDAERAAIAHLRDHGPDDWLVLHNIEIPVRGDMYEVDLVVVMPHAVCVIDVKGTRGRVEVAGRRWYPSNRGSFHSPVAKLRDHARALKGELARRNPALNRVYVDALVVLTAEDAVLIDASDRPDADAHDVARLDDLITVLADRSRVRSGFPRDIRRHRRAILESLKGVVQVPTGPQRFGNWVVRERLGVTDEITEYRAGNATVTTSQTVLLRVYKADPFQPESVRQAERIAIANAYEVLAKMPRHECVVGCRDFFATEDESQFVLVLDDVRGGALRLRLGNPRLALAVDARYRVIADILRGLAHAHAHRVIHRALSPASVLVATGGKGMLTGFDYARPEDPRTHTVVDRLTDVLDPAYVAPECQSRARAMSRASDVYAAGVIAYQLLAGELPFASTSDQYEKRSVLPTEPLEAAGVSGQVAELLRRMCAQNPGARPSAAEALRALAGASRATSGRGTATHADYRNLPEGHQLTRKFTIQRRLGKPGSFGAAYQVYDNLAGADRVVKIVDRDRESLVERLKHEYQILLGLRPHDNVIKVEGADYLDGGETPYLVFEYVEGQDVSALVEEHALGPADAVKLGVEVAGGLAFLHGSGIYHCDIKPGNLLWTDRGCKIIDFNVSVSAESSMSRAGGTAKYLPPDIDTRVPPTAADLVDRDVYALGVTLYQVLTGRYPFASGRPTLGEPPVDPRSMSGLSELSDTLVDTVTKAIGPLRSSRYRDAGEFLAALEAIGGEVHRRPPSTPPPEPRPVIAERNVNPFVAHLATLYSQSTSSNAGTRGKDPHDLYVATALDAKLIPDVLAGKYRLVVITGNAGDGKTAFLEHLVTAAMERGATAGETRENGADVRLLNGRWLRTNHDGSQDEGDKANDDVLAEFFAPFADTAGQAGAASADAEAAPETRLIAINEGRLVDFLTSHKERFAFLEAAVRAGSEDGPPADGIAVVNLNRRSIVAGSDELDGPIFDRMLARMTHDRFWEACESCDLVRSCYVPHNVRTLAHPSAGPKVVRRLRELYTLAHLRGRMHITLRDLRSALAFTLTSGKDCAQIHGLYDRNTGGAVEEILSGFYFNAWLGRPGTRDRLLAFLQEIDVAVPPAPALDRRFAHIGPGAGQAMMTIDQRGEYDLSLLRALFERVAGAGSTPGDASGALALYQASVRRRFYFEGLDDKRARAMTPFKSAERLLSVLARPEQAAERMPELIHAINRGEGLPDPRRLGDTLALQVRQVPGGTIRSYRLFPIESLSLSASGGDASPYLEQEPDGLVLTYHGVGGQTARLRIQLDLFELLDRLHDGYLPGIAEQQGHYLGLTIFKNELSAAPYQEIVLAAGSRDLHRVRREPGGRLVMEPLASERRAGSDDTEPR